MKSEKLGDLEKATILALAGSNDKKHIDVLMQATNNEKSKEIRVYAYKTTEPRVHSFIYDFDKPERTMSTWWFEIRDKMNYVDPYWVDFGDLLLKD